MRKFFFALLAIIFIQACQPLSDVNIEQSQVEVAMPLFHSKMSISEILLSSQDSTAIKVYPNNQISFLYEADLLKNNAEDLIGSIPENDLPILDTLMGLPLSFLIGVQINTAIVKSGFLHFTFTNNPTDSNVAITFSLPQLSINGVPLVKQFILPSPNSTHQDSLDLKDYILDISSDTLVLKYSAKDQNGNNVMLPIGIDKNLFSLQQIVFGYVEGHWDSVDHNFDQRVIEIDFFENNFVNGEVYFSEPKVDFTVYNGFGLPTRTKVNYFRIVETNGNIVPMISQALSDGIDFAYPQLNEVGKLVKTSFTFDKDNSNIAQVLNTNPKRVEYDIDVTVNPDNDPNLIGFSTDSSYFSIAARAELPLIGTIDNFIFDREYDMSFENLEAKEATLKIATDNEVPLEVAIQLYFLDASGLILDSLKNNDFAIVLDAADFPGPTSKHHENEFNLNAKKWSRIKNTKKIRVKGKFTSSQDGQQIVTFLADQTVHIKVGMKLKLQ